MGEKKELGGFLLSQIGNFVLIVGYADFMKVGSSCALFVAIIGVVLVFLGCAPKSLDGLPNLTRDETLWTGPTGSKVVIYRYGMAVGKTPEVLVCEQRQHRDLIEKLPADSFARASGHELEVIRQSNQILLQRIDLSRRCP